jgi:periplasmic protein TonB
MLESKCQPFSMNCTPHTMLSHPTSSHQTIATWGVVLIGHLALGLWILNTYPITLPPTPTITELQIIPFSIAPSPIATHHQPTPTPPAPKVMPPQPQTHAKITPPASSASHKSPSAPSAHPPRTEEILHTHAPSPSSAPTIAASTSHTETTPAAAAQENTPIVSTSKETNTTANAPQSSSQNSENTAPPRTITRADYLECPPKIYPAVSQSQGDEGTPIVEALINEEGKPENVHIYKKSGYRLLDKAAMDYVKQCRFKPTKENGKAAARPVHIPIQYALSKEEE